MPDSDSPNKRKLAALRKRGWGEAKIQRWLHEKVIVAAREERSTPPPPAWADDNSAETERQLTERYQASSIFLGSELWFDHETAVAFVDDAEAAGLAILAFELGYVRGGKLRLVVAGVWTWYKEAADSYARGGRDAVVHATAQLTRGVIRDEFPEEADVVSFYFN